MKYACHKCEHCGVHPARPPCNDCTSYRPKWQPMKVARATYETKYACDEVPVRVRQQQTTYDTE